MTKTTNEISLTNTPHSARAPLDSQPLVEMRIGFVALALQAYAGLVLAFHQPPVLPNRLAFPASPQPLCPLGRLSGKEHSQTRLSAKSHNHAAEIIARESESSAQTQTKPLQFDRTEAFDLVRADQTRRRMRKRSSLVPPRFSYMLCLSHIVFSRLKMSLHTLFLHRRRTFAAVFVSAPGVCHVMAG